MKTSSMSKPKRCVAAILGLSLLSLAAQACATDSSDKAESELANTGCLASGPALYANPRYESPVRGDPGDVLLLAGSHFDLTTTLVVYQAISDTTQPLLAPSTLPAAQTATEGNITPLSRDDNALSVVLPSVMTAGQSYALWAATPDSACAGEYDFSNGVLINDARPMWVTPGPLANAAQPSYPYVYSTANRPGIGRLVKIVGRNLQPAPGQQTQVRFTASELAPIILTAADDGDPATQIERYVAKVTLPATMPLSNNQATTYEIAVSRDGVSWVPLTSTQLTVLPDPAARTTANSFYPSDYGDAVNACSPCDAPGDPGSDDTLCITRAIHAARQYAAQNRTTGNVVFRAPACPNGQPATWIVAANCNPNNAGVLHDSYFGAPYDACYNYWGIIVPEGVNLIADNAKTQATIETEQGYDEPLIDAATTAGQCGAVGTACTTDSDCCGQGNAQVCMQEGPPGHRDGKCENREVSRQYLFNLKGNNIVQGLRFHDAYKASFATILAPDGPITFVSSPASQALLVAGNDMTITNNFFDDMYAGIQSYPVSLPDGLSGNMDLVITGNKFGCWLAGMGLGAVVEDGVLANNTFWPGAYLATLAGSELGGQRWDISSNLLDGTNSIAKPDGSLPAYSAPYIGWRAGFFFPTFSSQEDLLVAQNRFDCVGTRPYQDGEAISTDSNGDIAGLRSGQPVISVPAPTGTQVTIGWPASRNPADAGAPNDYKGRWLRVDYGPGLGQARKITGVSTTATTITFTISPALDVVPVAGQSRIIVGNQIWQMNIVDNLVDDTCSTQIADISTLHPSSTGEIGVYSGGVDVAIDSNHQIDTAGLSLWSQYVDFTTTTGAGSYPAYQTPQYFVEIRGNTIQGQFGGPQNPQNIVGSGIGLYTLSGTLLDGIPQDNPNDPGFGVSISHNTLIDIAMSRFDLNGAQSAAIALVPEQAGDQSNSPGYVDTLVFANHINGTTASTGGALSSAISNGARYTTAVGEPNYPRGTVICGNAYSNFPSLYSDWPAFGEVSSLVSCGP